MGMSENNIDYAISDEEDELPPPPPSRQRLPPPSSSQSHEPGPQYSYGNVNDDDTLDNILGERDNHNHNNRLDDGYTYLSKSPSDLSKSLIDDDHTANQTIDTSMTRLCSVNNNDVMNPQFRGIHHAQEYDEEEAAMDEIEVRGSSVVESMRRREEENAYDDDDFTEDGRGGFLQGRKRCMLMTVAACAVAALIAGVVAATSGSSDRGEISKSITTPDTDNNSANTTT